METNQLKSIGASTGLGWELNQPQYMGKWTNPGMIGKTGFTGCVIVLDIEKECSLVLLSNYTFPTRKADGKAINEIRRDIADLVFAP